MTSTTPTFQPARLQFKTLNARPATTDNDKYKNLLCNFPFKIKRNHISKECDQFKEFCCMQLRRLFTDFWSKESTLIVLSELVSRHNLFVLAIMREHIKQLIYCIERTPSAEVLVPLFKSAAEGEIAVSKAHLSHIKLLFYYVCLACMTCLHARSKTYLHARPGRNITILRGKPRNPPRRVVYPCFITRS